MPLRPSPLSALRALLSACGDMFLLPERFANPERERQFQADYCRRFAMQRRAVIFLGALSWLFYIFWDVVHARHSAQILAVLPQLLFWRVAGFVLLMCIGLLAMAEWFERDERAATRLLVLGNLALAAVAYWMMLLVPLEYAFRFYYFGLLISMVFAFGVLRLRAVVIVGLMLIYALAGTLLLLLMVELGAQAGQSDAIVGAWKLGNMMISIAIIGAAFGIQLERTHRASFSRELDLATYNQAIMAHSQEVEALNAAILRNSDVAEERHRALLELKEQMRAEAEARNREKSRFLAAAVHDLKQPVQAIGNALEPAWHLLQRGDAPRAAQMIEIAQRATHRMRSLLNDLLEMSRLESGYVNARVVSVNLRELIDEVMAQTAAEAAMHGVSLQVQDSGSADTDPMLAKTDRHFINRILLNLIGNGIKYRDEAKAERWVLVRLSRDDVSIWIDVDDNGIGIESQLLAQGDVFKPFFQVLPPGRRDDAGAGLGLSIVNAMLALLPSHQLIPSSRPGHGTCMRLILPTAPPGATLSDSPRDDHWRLAPLPSLYVLVIEDDELVRQSTCALLSEHGVLNEGYGSVGSLAADLARIERSPDVVLSDWRLPEGHGPFEVLALLEPHFGQIPCVVFTGERVDVSLLASFPIVDVLFKPVDSRALIEAIVNASRHSHSAAPGS